MVPVWSCTSTTRAPACANSLPAVPPTLPRPCTATRAPSIGKPMRLAASTPTGNTPRPLASTPPTNRPLPPPRGAFDGKADALGGLHAHSEPAAAGRFHAAQGAAQVHRLARDHSGGGGAHIHRVGVHHPGHDLAIGVHI